MFKYIKNRFKKQGLKMVLDLAINILTDIRNNIVEADELKKQQMNVTDNQNIKNHL